MHGTIRTYLPEKKYGFIKGDDGKDYFFHASAFRDKRHVHNLCEDALVAFDQQATPKGYKATNCSLLDPSKVLTYALPDKFIFSKSSRVRGFDVIEHGNWIIHGSSSDSPDAAKRDAMHKAEHIGANALINLEYYKTTGSSGNYNYTIHNYRGRTMRTRQANAKRTVSRRGSAGTQPTRRGTGKSLCDTKREKQTESKRLSRTIWLVIITASVYLVPLWIGNIVWLLILGIIFGRSRLYARYYGGWLQRA